MLEIKNFRNIEEDNQGKIKSFHIKNHIMQSSFKSFFAYEVTSTSVVII